MLLKVLKAWKVLKTQNIEFRTSDSEGSILKALKIKTVFKHCLINNLIKFKNDFKLNLLDLGHFKLVC